MQTHFDLRLESTRKLLASPHEWKHRHAKAWNTPNDTERGLVHLIAALQLYADLHHANHGSRIGDDSFGAPLWVSMVRDCRQLLNFDCGRLDCGTLDSLLCDMLRLEGFDSEGDSLDQK